MEFTTEFIETNGLTEDQVKGITGLASEHIATLKKEWDGKANENAEGILSGVVKSTKEMFGVDIERNQGEKYADYLKRVSSTHFESKNTEIENAKKEYQEKMKDFKGGDALKSELDSAKKTLDEALQKYANYDELSDKATKYDELAPQYSTLKQETAFNSVKPNFPEDANKFEVSAKWNLLKSEILKDFTIEMVDGQAKAVSKENKHNIVNLSDLVDKNESISELLKGRQQGGTGGKQVDLKTITGVPFKVQENATSSERSKAIRDYLATQNISTTHADYANKFAELNRKIQKPEKATA